MADVEPALVAPNRSRRWRRLLLLSLVAGAVTLGLVWFFGGDEPDQVDAERAVQRDQESLPGLRAEPEDPAEPEVIEGGEASDDPDDPDDPGGPSHPAEEPEAVGPPDGDADLDGRWVVDTSREFDRADGSGSFAGYRIQEELSGIGATTAVGRTPEVSGEVVFSGVTVVGARIEVDLTALVSDDSRRDARVRSQLGPDAAALFELTTEIALPEVPPVGEVIELTAPGTLTILGTSQEVEVRLQAAVLETGLIVAGSTVVVLSDYDIEVPSATIVLSVADEATLEWQLYLVPDA